MRIAGKLEGATFDGLSAALDDKLARHAKVRVYVEMAHFEGMSAEAVIDDLRLALRHWRDIEREAVVTGERWIRALTPLGDKLVPGVEVRAFDDTEREVARAWIVA